MRVPSELEMLEILAVEPIESIPHNGFWLYEVEHNDITLRLAFHVVERWIRTELKVGTHLIQRVEQEGAVAIVDGRDRRLADGRRMSLRGECRYQGAYSIVEIYLEPDIYVSWYTLLDQEKL